jgi:hypothetical protein
MSLQLHRPGSGGLEPSKVEQKNWRRQLRSRRWNVPELSNPEARPTSYRTAVAFFVGLCVLTFLIILLGYGTGFWELPPR